MTVATSVAAVWAPVPAPHALGLRRQDCSGRKAEPQLGVLPLTTIKLENVAIAVRDLEVTIDFFNDSA